MKYAFFVVVLGVCAVVKGDGSYRDVFEEFLPCAISLDMGCAMDRAEGFLRDTTKSLLGK